MTKEIVNDLKAIRRKAEKKEELYNLFAFMAYHKLRCESGCMTCNYVRGKIAKLEEQVNPTWQLEGDR